MRWLEVATAPDASALAERSTRPPRTRGRRRVDRLAPPPVRSRPVATEEELSACRAGLERVVRVDCRSGLYDEAEILEAVAEIIDAELGEPSAEILGEFAEKTRAGLEARAREEATWADRTINDRIEGAFADLDARGIVAAEQALGFTVQEGAARIDEERVRAREDEVRGSVFYHRQDLERGVDGRGPPPRLHGLWIKAAGASEAVGREIVRTSSRTTACPSAGRAARTAGSRSSPSCGEGGA